MANFRTFMDQFTEIVGKLSLYNETFGKMLFAVCAGQLIDVKLWNRLPVSMGPNKLDYRFSLLLIAPSRGGKGQATKVAKEFLDIAKIDWTKITLATEAGLVGQVDQELSKISAKQIQLGMTDNVMSPVIKGDLDRYRVIFYDEAKTLVVPGNFSQGLHEVLQEGMDTPGIIRKKLANKFPIEYETHSSIIATTYYLRDFSKMILEQGLFQRMLVLVEQIDINKRHKINDALCGKWHGTDVTADIKSLVNMMNSHIDQTLEKANSKNISIITASPKANDLIRKTVSEMLDNMAKNFQGMDLEVLLPFTTGSIEKFYKLSAMSAIFDKRLVIQPEDVSNAKSVILVYVDSIMNEILVNVEGTKTKQEALHQKVLIAMKYVGESGIPKEELYHLMHQKCGISSRNKCVKIVGKMISLGMLRVRKVQSGIGRPAEHVSPASN